MRMNELNQAGALSPGDLVLIWNGSQSRTAPFSLVTQAARDAVFNLINMPGGLEGIGAAASGANGDITALTGIKTSRVTTDLNQTDATGWWFTTTATSNQPEAKQFLVWDQHGDANHIAQIAISLDSGKVYTRKKTVAAGAQVATWSAWIGNLQVGDVTSDTIGATATGKALITAANAGAARTALGMTTIGSNLVLSSDAAGARSVLGAGTVGAQIFTAADGAAVRSLIAGTTGAQIMTQGNTDGVYAILGVTNTGKTLLKTSNADDWLTGLGGGASGVALFKAADAAAAQTALGATDTGKALLTATDKAAGRAAISALSDSEPTATTRGGVLQAAAQTDLTAAPTQADFNALLAKLRTAGVLAAA